MNYLNCFVQKIKGVWQLVYNSMLYRFVKRSWQCVVAGVTYRLIRGSWRLLQNSRWRRATVAISLILIPPQLLSDVVLEVPRPARIEDFHSEPERQITEARYICQTNPAAATTPAPTQAVWTYLPTNPASWGLTGV